MPARTHQGSIFRDTEQTIHDVGRGLQVANGFKQRHHIDGNLALGHIQQMGLFQQHRQFKQVTHRCGFGNDAVLNGRSTENLMRKFGLSENRHF